LLSIDGREASIYMFGEEDYSTKKASRKGAAFSFINLPQVRRAVAPRVVRLVSLTARCTRDSASARRTTT
jgi:hypothetical protein